MMSTHGTEQQPTVATTTRARPPREVLAWGREMIDASIRAAVDSLPVSVRHIAGYHLGWWDQDGCPILDGGGKAIRPTLVLLSAQAMGGASQEAVDAAVAVELAHNFSLLHDDVIDRDLTRRHRPTAWTVFGLSAAVLAGDALMALALDVLASSGHRAGLRGVEVLNRAVLNMVYGQTDDVAFEHRSAVGLLECLRMSERKTGALMGCACALGAMFGGADPQQVADMRAFGQQLGLAFQLVDDLLGIWGDPARTGKSVHTDLQNRKKSLPVVAAMASSTPAGRMLTDLYQGTEPMSESEAVQAAALVDLAGGRSWSEAQVQERVTLALTHLRSAGPAEAAGAELIGLLEMVAQRDH